MTRLRTFVVALTLAASLGLSLGSSLLGCGYILQNSNNPRLKEIGVQKIYVEPIVNNTYKPGVENLVYNELVKTLVANGRVQIVPKRELADAVLEGKISEAGYIPSARSAANSLFPLTRKTIEVYVATEYKATLSCNFTLERVSRPGGATGSLWSAAFVREKKFPGNVQKDEFGTTSALINESEFDRALRDIAQGMMGDVHESMLAMF